MAPLDRRPSVLALATRLESTILRRRLKPGDRFLTAREAAQNLRVRQDVANRALQVLVQRGVLIRRQRVGCFVADRPAAPPPLSRVHILIQEDHLAQVSSHISAVEVGLHKSLPGSEVLPSIVKTSATFDFLDPILRKATREKDPGGLILVRCDYPTQLKAFESGLPTIVHGTTYAGLALSSLNVDEHQSGRLQARALIDKGCTRLAVLRRDRSVPGDRDFLHGLSLEATKGGLQPYDIDVIDIPPYPDLVLAELRALVARKRRLGLIAATTSLAELAWDAALDLGLDPNRGLPILANRDPNHGSAPYPFLKATMSPEDQGSLLGTMLRERLEDPSLDPNHRTIPCELVYPRSARQ